MSKAWSDAELTTLRCMKADGAGPSEIAHTLGRSLKGVSAKIAYLKMSPEMRRERKQAERRRARPSYRSRKERKESSIWPPDRIEILFYLRDKEKKQWSEIAEIMGCTTSKVYSRYHYQLHSTVIAIEPVRALNIVPDHVHEDRLRRQLLSPRDLTAAFCGDPLPGFSALERRT